MQKIIVCRPKSLPLDLLPSARRRAVEINPLNQRERRSVLRTPTGIHGGQRRIAVVVARKWPAAGVKLSVSFLDQPSQALRTRILQHLNAWSTSANVTFAETNGVGQVRIARFDHPMELAGYWSYLGTEILEIPEDQPTMNLEGFTMRQSEEEFRRVVRHEAGHTLGFDHEHMRSAIVARIDRAKAIRFYDKDQGWTREEVEEQVLTPLSKRSIMGTTEADPLSIMCYQLPAEIMKDGKAVPGGKDINPRDAEFAARLYPKPSATAPHPAPKGPPGTEKSMEPLATPKHSRHHDNDGEDRDTFHIVVMEEFRSDGNDTPRSTKPSPARYAQVFATYGGARATAALRLGKVGREPPTAFDEICEMHARIQQYTNNRLGSLPSDGDMVAFGGAMFGALFQGDVRRLYDEARTRQRGHRLELILTSMIPSIAEKPWEFAYDTGRKSFLATEELHFVRNVLTTVPSDPIVKVNGPLRILVASAQPVSLGRLDKEEEARVIRRGFAPLIDAGAVEVEVLARTTPEVIHGHLSNGDYQIVHFIGHGVFDEQKREGCLVFEDNRGGEYLLGEREVREIFRGRNLSLVFLNACETGRGGSADFNKGVAQSLVQAGLPALVANQYSVLDSSATSFAKHFYWSLAQGLSLGQAAREARIAVNYQLHGELIDWAIPVLYARDSRMTLCERPAMPARVPATSIRPGSRHAVDRHERRIGVWDVDDVFPALEETLDGMNAAQRTFGFELVDTSLPLDVWDNVSSKAKRYLRADKLAERLANKPGSLRVELLVCVTREPMRDDEWLNIFLWWPDEGDPPIMVFSSAGFDVEPQGPDTDRLIVNAIVSGLAGHYGKVHAHNRKPTNCPMYFNAQRELDVLVSAQKFDGKCRAKLRRALGDQLDALEALLEVFA